MPCSDCMARQSMRSSDKSHEAFHTHTMIISGVFRISVRGGGATFRRRRGGGSGGAALLGPSPEKNIIFCPPKR